VKSFKLYLPNPKYTKWDVDCLRMEHIFKSIDNVNNEVRIYIEGSDFYLNESKHPLPYATIDGKKKSMDNLFKEAIGEKKVYDGE
jgi:hypothetical protein